MADRNRVLAIAKWRRAYETANSDAPPYRMVWKAGWFELRSLHSSFVIRRIRASELEAMTATLIARAPETSSPSPTTEGGD